ncbi:hypothetical protein LBBP_00572 [Leptospira borgpetersenii serovar Ballum]|uniref:Uncharacterized protein n=1 Tax=Leptospira borgpetersenii serovar Ballum TaxID=280505 RepID=A0A0S2IMQ8_LEPBO|nr:hypothetical protein LBBP_00572 [Leptospira borgpetersenii serovar Ballum]
MLIRIMEFSTTLLIFFKKAESILINRNIRNSFQKAVL